jgi:DeoR family transcriptional regulator, fructose operon transcriptional repressor
VPDSPNGQLVPVERAKLPPVVRRQSLLAAMARSGSATVGQLARELQVSAVTIHRDLVRLENQGLIVRVQGGATLADSALTGQFATAWRERLQQRPQAKLAMAVQAREFLEPHSTVFLDGSTTTLALAAAIEAEPLPLTIVTVSPLIAYALHAPGVNVVIVPGDVDPQLRAIGGSWAVEFLAGLNLSATFISGAGFTQQQGLTTTRSDITEILQRAMAQAASQICLVDSSKFGRAAMLTVASAPEFDAIVTDLDLDPELRSAMLAAGLNVVQPTRARGLEAARILNTSQVWAAALSQAAPAAPARWLQNGGS